MSRIVLCTVSLILVAMILACGGTGDRKAGTSNDTGADTNKTPTNVTAVSVKELLENYASNERSADELYKDKWFDIDVHVVKATDDIETSRLIVNGGNGAPSILCVFLKRNGRKSLQRSRLVRKSRFAVAAWENTHSVQRSRCGSDTAPYRARHQHPLRRFARPS